MIGFICGTGFEKITENIETYHTPFGKIFYSKINEVYVINRHMNNIPPHKVPYKAITYFFKKKNVRAVIAVSAVGALKENIEVGTAVLPDQLVDFSGIHTFFDMCRIHVSMTEPFSRPLRDFLGTWLKRNNVRFMLGGTYICMPGPQFETLAEVKFLRNLGDVVGMTVGAEAKLHREMNIQYQPICIVTNIAGCDASHENNVREAEKFYKIIKDLLESKDISKLYINI